MKWRVHQWARTPFPLVPHGGGSVLAVKGSLRRFAPWTAPGRSEGMTVYEGKGGVRAEGLRRASRDTSPRRASTAWSESSGRRAVLLICPLRGT